jgi:hypothetical protein
MTKRSIYLNGVEDRELRRKAEAEATSMNYLMRIGVRLVLGLPVPSWALEMLRKAEVQ